MQIPRLSQRAAAALLSGKEPSILTPMVIQGLIEHWPARSSWKPGELARRFGSRLFSLDGNQGVVTLKDFFMNEATASSTTPTCIFDPSFEYDCPELLTHYSIPPMFEGDFLLSIPQHIRPDHRWFLLGPKNSGSRMHVDPVNTSAWNALVYGEKKWHIVEPGGVVDEASAAPPSRWFSDARPVPTGFARTLRTYEFVQKSGETVFVPRGWHHAVLNLTWTVAITHNFVIPRRQDVEAFVGSYREAVLQHGRDEEGEFMTERELDEVARSFQTTGRK